MLHILSLPCVLTACGLAWLLSSLGVAAPPLVYERLENSTSGVLRGSVTFTDDVIACGGLAPDNRFAARFDGQPNTAIDLGPEIRIPSPDFTVEAFVKLAERQPYAAIAAAWNEDGDQRCWALVVTPRGGLRFDVSPDGLFHAGNKLETPPRLLDLNTWYHVAAVSQGATSRLYVNGREVAQARRAIPGLFTGGTAHLKLGNADRYATQGPRPLIGWLDEVRITTQPLQPQDFLTTREPLPPVLGPVPATYQLPFTATDPTAAADWQQRARARLLELVAKQAPRQTTATAPLDFQLAAFEQRERYTLYQASFQANDGQTRCACQLAVPDGAGPFPAMVALHGHGGNCRVVFDTKSIYHGFADHFARGGYVVLAPSFPHRKYAALMLWDLMRLVDILEARPDVARDRIGVAGLSMGGEWTMWLAACDPRLQVAVVSGWMCTTEGVFSVPNCECWELPGFVSLMDVADVHLLIAPRPVLFESAEFDNCFPIQFTRQGFERIRAGYRVFGARDAVRQDVWPAGHEWHGTLAYPFVNAALGGHAAP